MRSTGSWYIVRNEDGELVDARIKGKFRIKGIKTTNPIAVGDWVRYKEGENNEFVITEIEDRKNYVIRKSVNLSKQAHIIGANIDYALLVVTLANPRTSTGFIDRFLVSTEAYGIETILVFNKYDLLTEEEKEELEYLIAVYSLIGYRCVVSSAINGKGIEEIRELLKDKTTLLSGHSGAGKSSLINAIDGSIETKVGDISSSHYKGKHTTTFAEMFPLSFGGDIIDTPGIKGFGIIDIDKEELNHYFVEMMELLPNCKFSNCKHIDEPQCAVKKAVEDGEIAAERYNNYLAMMLEEDENHWRTNIYN
ncbi:Small ribosomal subunit biogenesis GTPase RsgA [Parvicella tangerina]|uniref:Small ribosomal subunit biogenesis GTPase RsgA n=2 Tax=Parvicella tangerina TaxID=2829795 RepID=A0A916JM67_9FLAO|nr:Small ribosomal subunit biogenesis GTPase RsgA [Parvicella tangerina]